MALNTGSALVSLRKRFVWLLTGVVGLFAAGMALSLLFSLRTNNAAALHLMKVEAAQARTNVMRRWNYYREVVDHLASDPQLLDLMRVGSTEDKQQWAVSRQRLLPNILGLAIVSPQGEVYGDTRLLRVGPSCQRDLLQRGANARNQVLIHRDVPGLEHVDLSAPVREVGGEVLGQVFLSVRLAQLQRIVDDSTQPGHAIAVVDAAGKPVVGSGSLQGAVREIGVALPVLGWTLRVQSPVQRITPNGRLQILAGGLTLIAVLLLLVVAVARLRRPVLQDIDAAMEALACLTRNESAPPIVTRYAEFAPAAANINRIAQQLHDQREQLARLSLTDPLTGLPNRRAFENRFPQMLGLAERGSPVALVLLDVDHFKSINDRFGHAAGDRALIALANALKALTRSSDMAARLAGDEFAVLLSGLDDDGVLAWYRRLAGQLQSELRAVDLAADSTVSAGQTWLRDAAGDNIEQAFARADRALYRAKALGRGQLAFASALRANDAG
jgi:diguanylate cyclase (GGDEF)-like protein